MFKKALEEVVLSKVCYDEPMKKHTSLCVGGNSDYYVEVNTLCSLNQLVSLAKKHRVCYKVLGFGSNVLVSDKGYNGLIISIKKINDIFYKRDYIQAMAGASLDSLIRFNREHDLSGLEALSGIPASVGGAIVMNAGAFGRSISDSLVEVHTLCNGKIKKYHKTDCKFSYRTSRFLNSREIIICGLFDFEKSNREAITEREKTYLDIRKTKQPQGRTCGSVFKNPYPYYAGELIERAGLKGFSIGGATVSEKHANFITVSTNTTASDVHKVISYIKDKIQKDFGISLEEEVEYLGEF